MQERVISNLAEYGNTSAASIPLALDEAVRSGSIKQGDVVRPATYDYPHGLAVASHGWKRVNLSCVAVMCVHLGGRAVPPQRVWHVAQIAMAGFGAGLTWASAIVKWG